MTQAPITDHAPRCRACGKMLIVAATRPWVIDCYHRVKVAGGGSKRCGTRNDSSALPVPTGAG